MNKQEIRKKLIADRLKIPLETAKQAADSLAEYLLSVIPMGVVVAGYCAIRGEIDANKALISLLARGNKVALPVVTETGRTLKFLDHSSGEPLQIGKFGISCPQSHSPEIVPEVVIVPLVGFDISGNRLGYGCGYYDTTISSLRAKNKTMKIIGIAYNMQKLENIPTEPHDEKMNMVITEREIINCV
ncbi:MAG: 5-formyltetrahydrofolate cyclo-ligase [Rickettsiales bacterium]|jgi:5-formyltetrahydrofolate cyclo-ligase